MFNKDEYYCFKTEAEAKKTFSEFSGYYFVLKYGYSTWREHFGSNKHGQWYCHTGFVPGKTLADQAAYYELFQIGPRGGVKRLKKVSDIKPDVMVYDNNVPNGCFIGCLHDGCYVIDANLIEALIPTMPNVKWHGLTAVTDHHL